jgi:ubiquinone/menaquinone biosynthesis C-methylase UbiE
MNKPIEPKAYSSVILEHYRREAELHGVDASSTMRDQITRGREIASVERVLSWLGERNVSPRSLLDIGCGNAYLLEVLRRHFPQLELTGLEYTPEMCEVARQRGAKGVAIVQGDVRTLPFETGQFDAVVTERCIINVMDVADQEASLREVARVLKRGGHFLCVEAFTDAFGNLNAARKELGLGPNVVPHHNVWFDKKWFLDTIDPHFEIVDLEAEEDPSLPAPNFLSSHYFMSRVVYPLITKADVTYNTHFVRFFSYLPPLGNYSPIQFYLLRRR